MSAPTLPRKSLLFPQFNHRSGRESDVVFQLEGISPGEDSISCRILTPTQLVDEFAFGGGQRDSQNSVNWAIVDDDEGFTMIPALIVLAISASVGGYFLLSIYNEREEELDE